MIFGGQKLRWQLCGATALCVGVLWAPSGVLAQPPQPGAWVRPDLSAVAPTESIEPVLVEQFSEGKQYRPIDQEECRRSAAQASTAANLLDMELALLRQTPIKSHGKARSREIVDRHLKQKILLNMSAAMRNDSVAEALQTFYMLAAAEAKLEVLRAILAELDSAIAETSQQKKEGIQVAIDPEELRKQRETLLNEGIVLLGKIKTLSAALAAQLDFEQLNGGHLLWPVVDWKVDGNEVDPELAVSIGLANNPELALLDELICRLDADTLLMLEGFLSRLQPFLSIARSDPRLGSPCKFLMMLIFPPKPDGATIEGRRMQLIYFRQRKRTEVAARILEAAFALQAAENRLAFLKSEGEIIDKQVADAHQKVQLKLAPRVIATKAEIDRLRHADQVIQQVAEWYIARIKLLAAQSELGSP